MAQPNSMLNQDEILHSLENDGDNAFRILPQDSINGVLRTESAEQLRIEGPDWSSAAFGMPSEDPCV